MINFMNTGNEELVEEMMGKGRVLGGLTAQVAKITITITVTITITITTTLSSL